MPGAAPGTAGTPQHAEVAELLPQTSKTRSSHSSDPLDMLFERMSRKAVLTPEEEFRVSSQARVRSLRALAGAAPDVRFIHARPAFCRLTQSSMLRKAPVSAADASEGSDTIGMTQGPNCRHI